MTLEAKLLDVVGELVARVNALSGHAIEDVADLLGDPLSFAHLHEDRVIALCARYLEGAADALDLTVLELLSEHSIRTETRP